MTFPIYTQENNCQDCYKCLRACSVKAIQIREGHARIIQELCVLCGTCVTVCPVRAKKIRNDLGEAKDLLAREKTIFASLAPSWVGEFPGVAPEQMVRALKRLGFTGVGETALGAQEVSAGAAAILQEASPGLYLSTACPSAVQYVRKYLPYLVPCLLPQGSPLLAHARILQRCGGANAQVIFFGPCIAKKWEADSRPEEIRLALTFEDLRQWMENARITFEDFREGGEAPFFPQRAREGAHYPVEGGMIRTIEHVGKSRKIRFLTLTGMANLREALEGLDPGRLQCPLFVECLACPGGCINGPASREERPVLERWMDVEAYAPEVLEPSSSPFGETVEQHYQEELFPEPEISEEELLRAFQSVGKFSPEDEINCGGCGYESCREFAKALVMGRGEPTMCVSYMRKKAQKKANALLRSMPSGVVIVDQDMKIVECNERFARFMGEEVYAIYQVIPGMKGCILSKVFPLEHLFQGVLETNEDVSCDHFRHGEMLFDITIFSIEPFQTVGAVLTDVTRRELQRDQIAHRAEEVIQRNLSTVQEIACKLGEHMADTEILLRSIAEGYAAEEPKAVKRES
jgi:iron only hydrogenase large subunit-like protein